MTNGDIERWPVLCNPHGLRGKQDGLLGARCRGRQCACAFQSMRASTAKYGHTGQRGKIRAVFLGVSNPCLQDSALKKPPPPPSRIVIASRESRLALWQAG